MLAVLDLAFIHAAALAAAATLAAVMRVRPLSLLPLAIVLLSIVIQQVWVLASGLAGALTVDAWRVISIALLALTAAAAWIAHRRLLGEWRLWRRRARRTMAVLGVPAAIALPLGIAAWCIALALAGWLVGPWLPDVLSYHLAPPADWVAHGRIAPHDWPDPRAWWPQGHGLAAAWWLVPTHDVRFAQVAGVQWVVLLAAATWALTRRLARRSVRPAAAAAALLVAVPILWAQAPSGLNDLPVAAAVIAALAALAAPRCTWQHVLLAAAAMAVGIGVKVTMLLFAPALVALAAFRALRGLAPRRSPAPSRLAAWLLVIASSCAGGYWYARNALAHPTGNPLYPASVQLPGSGAPLLAGHAAVDDRLGRPSPGRLRANMLDLFTRRGWDLGGFTNAQTRRGSGIGLTAMGLGWVAMIYLLITSPRARPAALATIAMMLCLSFVVTPDDFTGRLYCFLPPVLIACVVLAARRLRPPPMRYAWLALIALTAAWSAAQGAIALTPVQARHYWRSVGRVEPVPAEAMLSESYPFLLHSLAALPDDGDKAPLVVITRSPQLPVALMHGPTLRRRLIYADTFDEAGINAWRERGARHVYIDPNISPPPIALPQVAPNVYLMP